MTGSTGKPRGRRPGGPTSRRRFGEQLDLVRVHWLHKVTLRSIAREADMDPALIHRYFASKFDLFGQTVLDLPVDARQAHTFWTVRRIRSVPAPLRPF